MRAHLLDEYDKIRLEGAGLKAARVWYEKEVALEVPKEKLQQIVGRLQDDDATAAVNKIIKDSNTEQITRALNLLSGDTIENAIHSQSLTEREIREKAKIYNLLGKGSILSLRRKYRQAAKQGVARVAMTLGLVGHDAHLHATPFEIDLRNQQKARWKKFGESKILERNGQSFPLLDVMSNASRCRMAEVLALTKGLERHAQAADMEWAFITLTAPPRMHCNPKNGRNSWDGTTPDLAHSWIHERWHKAEARLRKAGVIMAGLRTTEAQQDGCPHWHTLVFANKVDMPTIEAELRKVPEWRPEAGCKWMDGEQGKGKAAPSSYVFKYILKTLSSIEMLEGEMASNDAWRSTWAIRAFQWFGMPSVGLWRNLRQLESAPTEPLLAGLWRAAKRGDGHAFIGLAGGLNVKAKNRPVVSKQSGDAYDTEKHLHFTLNKNKVQYTFSIKKWERTDTPKPRKPAPALEVEVIHNYPRESKAKTKSKPIPPLSPGWATILHGAVREGGASFAAPPCPNNPSTLHVGYSRENKATTTSGALAGAPGGKTPRGWLKLRNTARQKAAGQVNRISSNPTPMKPGGDEPLEAGAGRAT